MFKQKRWIVPAAAAVLTMAAGDSLARTQAGIESDGCDRLARLVTDAVVAAFRNDSHHAMIDEGDELPQVVSCDRTTATVSAAFVDGLGWVGADVGWRWPGGGPGDVCLSGFLDQCYPDRGQWGIGDPVMGTTAEPAWRAVRETVSRAMPLGVASDQAVFAIGPMRQALASALEHRARQGIAK